MAHLHTAGPAARTLGPAARLRSARISRSAPGTNTGAFIPIRPPPSQPPILRTAGHRRPGVPSQRETERSVLQSNAATTASPRIDVAERQSPLAMACSVMLGGRKHRWWRAQASITAAPPLTPRTSVASGTQWWPLADNERADRAGQETGRTVGADDNGPAHRTHPRSIRSS